MQCLGVESSSFTTPTELTKISVQDPFADRSRLASAAGLGQIRAGAGSGQFRKLFRSFFSGDPRLILARCGLPMDSSEKQMLRLSMTILVLVVQSAAAQPFFAGEADFHDDASRALAAELLTAHGGMAPFEAAPSVKFSFFTKMLGNPNPFYSHETLDLDSGRATIDWPFWNATIGWDGERVWTKNWPMPLPAGFFVRLSSTFLTLPWQIHSGAANIGPVSTGQLPGDDTDYEVLRVTFDHRHPGIPGTFYEIFVHPETRLMAGLRFDINHPGMVANPSQPLGPNYHVFGDYRRFNELVIPTFYKSYGQGSGNGGQSNAYHFVWDMKFDQPFDDSRVAAPTDAEIDRISMEWWQLRGSK